MAHLAPEFIGWLKPLAEGVAGCILKGRTGSPVDLGSHRVIVPSSFASRLIQEELAKQAPNGVLLPVFQTPTEFLNFGDSNVQAAKSADALLAWIEVIQGRDRASLPFLFPNAKPGRFSFEEAKRLAETLFELRDELGGSAQGLDFADVAALPKNPEAARWNDLATLESGYREVLTRRPARRAEAAALTRECHQVVVTTVIAVHAREAVRQDPAPQERLDLPHAKPRHRSLHGFHTEKNWLQ